MADWGVSRPRGSFVGTPEVVDVAGAMDPVGAAGAVDGTCPNATQVIAKIVANRNIGTITWPEQLLVRLVRSPPGIRRCGIY
jgi:hypothetical protein